MPNPKELDINTAQLPVIPVDNTPNTTSATPNYVLVGAADARNPNRVTLTTAGETARGATEITLSTGLPSAVPAGTVLDFAGVSVTLSADAAEGATTLAVNALTTGLPAASTAEYGEFRRVPLTEEFGLDLKDDNETIKVYGRLTPLVSKNGVDVEASLKTVAGLQDPTIKDLLEAGMKLGRGAKRTLIFVYNDGFVVMCRMLVGVGKPDSKAGAAMRYDFGLALAGDLYWANLNEETVTWKKVQ